MRFPALYSTVLAALGAPAALALSTDPPVSCEVPNPCQDVAPRELESCASAKADWIVEGRAGWVPALRMIEIHPATALKGNPPLLDSNDGKWMQDRGCWGTRIPLGDVRLYGHASRGIFAAIPLVPKRPAGSPLVP